MKKRNIELPIVLLFLGLFYGSIIYLITAFPRKDIWADSDSPCPYCGTYNHCEHRQCYASHFLGNGTHLYLK